MVIKYFLSSLCAFTGLWPLNLGLAAARGADSAPNSASETPGQDGWCAKPQQCVRTPAAVPAQRPSRPQHAGQGPSYFPKAVLMHLLLVHCAPPHCPCQFPTLLPVILKDFLYGSIVLFMQPCWHGLYETCMFVVFTYCHRALCDICKKKKSHIWSMLPEYCACISYYFCSWCYHSEAAIGPESV